MAEDKVLNLILSKIEDLDSKFDTLNSKFDKLDNKVTELDNKVANLDSRVDGLEVNLTNFRGEFNKFRDETNQTLARIEKRADATFEQVGGLSEYRMDRASYLNIYSEVAELSEKFESLIYSLTHILPHLLINFFGPLTIVH
ncbi:hypothetical protein [Halanaerobium congolense]|uniref:t-SNARE coiled-coil homology domain-containing protein n=1 Tax=Halanaerobium congolense TaxID=54121 RepID=A0A1G6NF62_9FIRM|nr:hypothetical protein [Halanaerobium congolense]SDC66438.1 hypothetical protein SAMN04488597_11157 [Halanaerobium congolense]